MTDFKIKVWRKNSEYDDFLLQVDGTPDNVWLNVEHNSPLSEIIFDAMRNRETIRITIVKEGTE